MLDSDFDELPDINGDRGSFDLFCPDMEPGDLLLFNAHIVHGSSENYSLKHPRRALSSRWCDDTVVFQRRHATMPLMFDHGLKDGETLAGSLFPQILPEPIAAESHRRLNGPEKPDRLIIHQRVSEMAQGMRSSS